MAPCAICRPPPHPPTNRAAQGESSAKPWQPARAILRRPKTGQPICKECFFMVFEEEIHRTIMGYGSAEGKGKGKAMFVRGEKVGVGASGGKDSTVLIHIMKLLNERYDYGLQLRLLSIDEGIKGYRDDSLETVKRNSQFYELPLHILSYNDLYQGWTMDRVVQETGKKGNCTYCGVFRRQALDKGAVILDLDHIVTGHNADDVAETVLMNVLRGDIARLERCTAITTGDKDSRSADVTIDTVRRSKPFKYAYEKEIVMYAYFKKLDYHSTECIYSPTAYRGVARSLVKDLESIRPSAIVDIIYSGEAMATMVKKDGMGRKAPVQQVCKQCGSMSSQDLCQACALLIQLNKGVSKIRIQA